MKLIIGLGNPEDKYASTRHNVGFRALDYFREQNDWPSYDVSDKFNACISRSETEHGPVLLVKPMTYMNNSGEAVAKLAKFYKVTPKDMLVVYDELALEFGYIRTRTGGSSAGHNGIKSLIEHVKDGFHRLRIGIKNPEAAKMNTDGFVLAPFNSDEERHLPEILDYTNHVIYEFILTDHVEPHTKVHATDNPLLEDS